jgi:hypothetical protein
MNEPGITTDKSRERPSRRADLPSQPFEPSRRIPRFARLTRIFLTWRSAPRVARVTDLTISEGAPTQRADLDLPWRSRGSEDLQPF